MKKIFYFTSLLVFLIGCEKKINTIEDISESDWYIWLDREAQWINDSLYLPPVNIKNLPYNQPTCGWEQLYENKGQKTNLPATIEEYFWNENGNQYGISGNYKGVSWFFTTINIPESSEGKRLVLNFESVRMRAEVFVNNKLAGYDLIDGTPFRVDISEFAKCGEKNKIAIRITDPNGNFNWRDSRKFKWGNYVTISSHGFGGITGKVFLETTDPVYIDDLYIKNKPRVTSIETEVKINSINNEAIQGLLSYEIFETVNPDKIVYHSESKISISNGENIQHHEIDLMDAKLWSLENPNLYTLLVKWENDCNKQVMKKDFGFRWFDVAEDNGNRIFILNNKRIVLRSAISWSFWPVNGMYPSPELARKQVANAKKLGLNMLNFHRAIGCNLVFEEADKQGLLYYEEPGAYRTGIDEFSKKWAREKLLRMIKRDRSHPSLIIYNMQNEIGRDPSAFDIETIKMAHELDVTRLITYTSTNFSKGFYNDTCPDDTAQIKMHMVPYNSEVQYFGYWDQHHAGGPGVYHDELYKSPGNYQRFTENKKEIVFYGEEGAIGTPHQLPEIVQQLKKDENVGWDGIHYINTYNAYDKFLREKGFYNYFKDMASLLTSMGNVSHYHQGRIIENIRINNSVDGYMVNGWESEKIENHSGIVDIYRNIKGDPKIMAYYNQPLYVAVKVRNKVIQLGDKIIIDFFLVNEKDIKGSCELQITCSDQSGIILEKKIPVQVSGGNEYGQLLVEGIVFKPVSKGYSNIKANLMQGDKLLTSGQEQVFSVKLGIKDTEKIAVCDDSGNSIQKILETSGIENISLLSGSNTNFDSLFMDTLIKEKILIPGLAPSGNYARNQTLILEWVMDGNTLIILKDADKWAEYLNLKEVIDYRGRVIIDKNWYGGNHFVKEHPLFSDLPVNCAFNWEYQCLAQYRRKRSGLRLEGEECIVGVQCEHKPELFTAVGIIPLGRGRIIISTLDLEGAINSGAKSSVVAKKILQNFIEYASENK